MDGQHVWKQWSLTVVNVVQPSGSIKEMHFEAHCVWTKVGEGGDRVLKFFQVNKQHFSKNFSRKKTLREIRSSLYVLNFSSAPLYLYLQVLRSTIVINKIQTNSFKFCVKRRRGAFYRLKIDPRGRSKSLPVVITIFTHGVCTSASVTTLQNLAKQNNLHWE